MSRTAGYKGAPPTLRVVAWVNHRLGEQLIPRGSSKLFSRVNISPAPPQGTIDGATQFQTPSRAEHGPEGVLSSHSCPLPNDPENQRPIGSSTPLGERKKGVQHREDHRNANGCASVYTDSHLGRHCKNAMSHLSFQTCWRGGVAERIYPL